MNGPIKIQNWQKISDLGSGAFGVVSLWKNTDTHEFIAIKKCKFQLKTNLSAKQRERWKKEVEIMKLINHPNIIKFKEIPTELETSLLKNNPTKLPLLSMEYCTKGNLRHVLCRPNNLSGLQETDVHDILEDISTGLQHLHKLNITHRDVKPDNIVLQHYDERENNTIYKIIDLGYAKELNDSTVSFVGTLHYLAPEIFESEKYDNSVDYWSMGVLTFEIVCGVLPFLPQLTPVERFTKIKEKGPDDICIYQAYSGQIGFSTEIKKEHFVSSCFKQNLEVWLRHVLQYDRSQRVLKFPNGVSVFDYLLGILQKKIICVFSVYKMEMYSYEITNSTLVGTLKDWICRDIKATKSEIILSTAKGKFCYNDNVLLSEVLDDDKIVYVIKKCNLIFENLTYSLPKLVKELVISVNKFSLQYIKPLCAQMIFYITIERNMIRHFKQSFSLYVSYLNHQIDSLIRHRIDISKHLSKLLTKIECYNNLRRNHVNDIDVSENTKYKICLIHYQRLLASLERSIKSFNDLERKMIIIKHRKSILYQLLPTIEELLDKCDLEKVYQDGISLLERAGIELTNKTFIIAKLISEVIKIKETCFRNKKFRAYISAIANVLNSADRLLDWIERFMSHVNELSECFEHEEVAYRDILLKAAKIKKIDSTNSLKKELLDLPSDYLIQENQEIRYRFEELIYDSILHHKNYADSIKFCIT